MELSTFTDIQEDSLGCLFLSYEKTANSVELAVSDYLAEIAALAI